MQTGEGNIYICPVWYHSPKAMATKTFWHPSENMFMFTAGLFSACLLVDVLCYSAIDADVNFPYGFEHDFECLKPRPNLLHSVKISLTDDRASFLTPWHMPCVFEVCFWWIPKKKSLWVQCNYLTSGNHCSKISFVRLLWCCKSITGTLDIEQSLQALILLFIAWGLRAQSHVRCEISYMQYESTDTSRSFEDFWGLVCLWNYLQLEWAFNEVWLLNPNTHSKESCKSKSSGVCVCVC